jgi:hypothetical protein
MDYEYRVIPAPKRLRRIKGVSATADLVAATLTDCINAEARQGWEYVRTEQVAAEEPAGWFRRARQVEETVMIFRRPRRGAEVQPEAQREAATLQRGPHPGAAALRGRLTGAQQRIEESRETRNAPRPPVQQAPSPGTPPPLLRPVPRHTPGEKG